MIEERGPREPVFLGADRVGWVRWFIDSQGNEMWWAYAWDGHKVLCADQETRDDAETEVVAYAEEHFYS
ncbi:hypothetical protein ACIBG8_19400 [Nonomuraea sp. NPDC050556]|uniref:hypothetical protein n=1 Tax=Nonomuraea sp. NPDC050556 TaxID=3364369 RepID=UPI0037B3EA55